MDTSAVLERSWAALAGLGWIGKNTLLIHPKFGSYLFLGEVLINQRTHRSPAPLPNFCGHCTQCLKSCPPQALSPQGQLNSNQCISYWTLEKKGPHEIPDTEQKKIHTWIAGCDLCQEVCPFNQKISRAAANEQIAHALGATALQTWAELLNESPEEYKARVRDSALSRIKYSQSSRNLAIALHNQLEAQATEASRWQSLIPLLQKRLEAEADSYHRENWKKCLALLDFDSYSTF